MKIRRKKQAFKIETKTNIQWRRKYHNNEEFKRKSKNKNIGIEEFMRQEVKRILMIMAKK